jgi:hypothetical protein
LSVLLLFAHNGAGYQFVEFLDPDDQIVNLKWGDDAMPVPYWVYNRPPNDFTLDETVAAVQASFETWEAIESSSIRFQYSGTTNAEPFVFFDFINSLGFVSDADLEGSGILGATNWIFFTFTGEIAESDIFFNSFFDWSVDPNGEAGHFDFQSVVTHEIGHFLGLGHSSTGIMETSGLRRTLVEGSAIMYPFAYPAGSTAGRTPVADDIAGISVLYPEGRFISSTGSISGRVTKNGQEVYGAYVNAFNPFTGETIGFFTDRNGRFQIEGLQPGPHVVRVNPITEPTTPEDYSFPDRLVDTDFRDALFEGRAEVGPGQTTSNINFEVQQ